MTQQVLAPSARNPRLPAGCKSVNILGRVHVAVVPRPAIGTSPVPDFQRHGLLVGAASRTGLATREPAVYRHYLPPVPRRLVLDLPAELAHPHVGNRASEVMVLQHPRHVQIFQRDHVGASDNRRGGLVQEVGAHRRDVGVGSSRP